MKYFPQGFVEGFPGLELDFKAGEHVREGIF